MGFRIHQRRLYRDGSVVEEVSAGRNWMTVERNDPCPCGSGKKYKNCHQKQTGGNSRWIVLSVGILVVGLVVVTIVLNRSDAHEQTTARLVPSVPGQATGHDHASGEDHPVLPAHHVMSDPATWTWNDEHFHWHTPEGALEPSTQHPPPDHTWSEEHQHWHHKDGGHASVPPVDGQRQDGYIWNEEHQHWHPEDGGEEQGTEH